VVNHPPLAAFSTVNVGYSIICLNLVFRQQNIHMLLACLVSKFLVDANALITQFNPPEEILAKFSHEARTSSQPTWLLPIGCIVETSELWHHTSTIDLASPYSVRFNAT
jgi:hypothetical protein